MTDRVNRRLFIAMTVAVSLALPYAGAQVASDPFEVALLTPQYKFTRLALGNWVGMASFHVDVDAVPASRLWFRIRASSPLVQTWIKPPNQPTARITPDNVGNAPYNGTYVKFEGGAPGLFILPTNDPGYQYIYEFLSQGPGQYTVQLIANPDITGDVAVITELITESPVAVTLIAVPPEANLWQTVVLTAAVFDGPTPVPGAKVPVTIISPSGVVSTLTLYDDGEFPKGDHLARDGLYSGVFVPTEVGEYTIHASITGYRSANPDPIFFQRDAGTSVRVVSPCANLTGFLADYGQDDNSNGRYEWLVIEAEATVSNAGTFILQAILETATGKTLSAYGQDLTGSPGTQLLKARVSSDAIHAAGDPGPYRVVSVDLSCLGEDGAIPAGRFLPNTDTHPYRLAQFEPPPPPDCNSNGIGDPVEIAYGLVQDCDLNGIPDECGPAPQMPGDIVWNSDSLSSERTTRSLRLRVELPTGATGSPGESAIKVTMVDLQHPVPANLLDKPPPNFTSFDTRFNGLCFGGSYSSFCSNSPETICTSDANCLSECFGGSCTLGGQSCTPTAPCTSGTCTPGHHCGTDADCRVCLAGPNAEEPCTSDADCGTLPYYCPVGGTCYGVAGCTAAGEMNGCARWVGKPGNFLEQQDAGPSGGTYKASRLQCTPYYTDWIAETASGPIAVVGAEIIPSSTYQVEIVGASCAGNESCCAAVSPVATMTTRRSGDVAPNFNPPSTSTQPDALDVAAVVNKLKNLPGALPKSITQLQPNLPELNADINALDIVAVIDAVRQSAYSFRGPCPCPSTVACDNTPCSSATQCEAAFGAGSMCVKTCAGGDNDAQPCINNTHCPGSSCGSGFCRDRCGRCNQ